MLARHIPRPAEVIQKHFNRCHVHVCSQPLRAHYLLTPCTNLCLCRCELVTGASEPTAEELQGYHAGGDAAEPKGAKGGRAGVPFFWLNVLCSQVLYRREKPGRSGTPHSRQQPAMTAARVLGL